LLGCLGEAMTVVSLRKGANKHFNLSKHALPAEERRAQGKALRNAVPREAHGTWKAPKGRRDPVDLLTESNKRRLPQFVPIRFGRMLQSPFTFKPINHSHHFSIFRVFSHNLDPQQACTAMVIRWIPLLPPAL